MNYNFFGGFWEFVNSMALFASRGKLCYHLFQLVSLEGLWMTDVELLKQSQLRLMDHRINESEVVAYSFWCDDLDGKGQCKHHTEDRLNRAEALLEAYDHGFRSVNGKLLCVDCQRQLEER